MSAWNDFIKMEKNPDLLRERLGEIVLRDKPQMIEMARAMGLGEVAVRKFLYYPDGERKASRETLVKIYGYVVEKEKVKGTL